MSGNSFGERFRVTTFGESHGVALGAVVEGCPPGLAISEADLQGELDRRKPGTSRYTTQRKEPDQVRILSGVFEGKTTGTSIGLLIENTDQKSKDYSNIAETFRPGHADYTYTQKYGFRDYRGGGRSSARETVGRVAAGAIAKKILATRGVDLRAYVRRVSDVEMPDPGELPTLEQVDATPVRCPHKQTAVKMIDAIMAARKDGDSLGGVVECRALGLPSGLGCPVFDRLEADLAKAMLSLPATKGFEIGSGFAGTYLKGSEHNDLFENRDNRIRTKTNRSGGVQGGTVS